MGRFFAIILLTAACGDNLPGTDPAPPETGGTTKTNGGFTPQPRMVPEICGEVEWPTIAEGRTTALDLSVANNDVLGATVLAVPQTGGTITGFNLNERLIIMGNPTGTKIPIADTFTSVSASSVGGRTVSTAIDSTSVQIALLDDQLANPISVAKLAGTAVAKPAFYHTGSDIAVPYATSLGLWLATFDFGWQQVSNDFVARTNEPVIGVAATQSGDTILTAYTTADSCYIELLATGKPGSSWQMAFSCAAPRIATDYLGGTAKLVYEADGGVRLTDVVGEMAGDSHILRTDGRAPRIVFDGTRYWVSYLDPRGNVIVGYLDDDDHLWQLSLEGPQPRNDAYELTLLNDGTPWVFSVDATGYQAHHLCLDAVW